MLKARYKRDTEVRFGCNVNKSSSLIVVYKLCNVEIYHFLDKMTVKNNLNKFNIFINTVVNNRMMHLTETYHNTTQM